MAYTRIMGEMSKRNMEIVHGYCFDRSVYGVSIYNAILHKNCFDSIVNIIKDLTNGEEMFFGFYRIDGLTLTNSEFSYCDENLPVFFKKNGEYRKIMWKKRYWIGKEKTCESMLSVARAYYNQSLFNNLKWILQYHLETTFFVPNMSFDEFEKMFSGYMKNSPLLFIQSNYTDFEFSYYDSRHFSIYFDPQKINKYFVIYIIEKYFL